MAGNGALHDHSQPPGASHGHGPHAHTHGAADPSLLSTERGIWAVKWSFAGLLATAGLQAVAVIFTGSVALLADTVHNFGDAATAIPLWIAFALARLRPNQRYTYGYGRVEDLAGLAIVLAMMLSAALAGYESVSRLINPQPVSYLPAVMAASLLGFLGNEAVALFRIRVGQEIGSAALVADGYHARTDGWSSLAVLAGAVGVGLGFPLADPLAGLIITAAILRLVWEAGGSVFSRLIDGVDPVVADEVRHAVSQVEGVQGVNNVRVRWLGHRLHAELNLAVRPDLSVAEGHTIALAAEHQLLHRLRYLSGATIHIDPADAAGNHHHAVGEHAHDDYPPHAHAQE